MLLVELLTGELPYAHTYLTPVQIALAVSEEQLAPQVCVVGEGGRREGGPHVPPRGVCDCVSDCV